MAKWRAIYADISTSGQVNKLTEFEQLLFTWMIPHADDWGVLTGDLAELKLKVIPGSARQSQEMDDALRHIQEVGLIWRYEADGYGPLIQFCKWDDHQPIRKERRSAPLKPLYNDRLPDNAGQCQEKTGYTRLDKTIPDQTEDKTMPVTFSSIWLKELKTLDINKTLADEMDDYIGKITPEFFRAAVLEMLRMGKRAWGYCKGIIDNCMAEGRFPGEGKRGKSSRDSEPQLTPEQIAEYFPES